MTFFFTFLFFFHFYFSNNLFCKWSNFGIIIWRLFLIRFFFFFLTWQRFFFFFFEKNLNCCKLFIISFSIGRLFINLICLGLVGYARRDYFWICYIGICPTIIGNDRPNIRFFNATVGSSKSVSFEWWFDDWWKNPQKKK